MSCLPSRTSLPVLITFILERIPCFYFLKTILKGSIPYSSLFLLSRFDREKILDYCTYLYHIFHLKISLESISQFLFLFLSPLGDDSPHSDKYYYLEEKVDNCFFQNPFCSFILELNG